MRVSAQSWLIAFGLLAVVGSAAGCVVGQRIPYDSAAVLINHQGQGPLAVVAQDRRQSIVSGEKTPDYVGVQRSGFGIPHWLRTGSKRPLADDMCAVLTLALAERGYQVTPIVVNPGTPAKVLVDKIRATGIQGSIVLYIDQWESDTFTDIGLEYDLMLVVVNSAGKVMAKAMDSASKRLEGSAWDPVGTAQEALPKSLARKLTKLVNAPQIVRALQDLTPRRIDP